MLSFTFYKLLHLLGVFLLLFALGSSFGFLERSQGTTGEAPLPKDPKRRKIFITHGIALFLILLSGFGMLARLGVHSPLPGWVFGKLVIWGFFALALSLAYRIPAQYRLFRLLCILAALGAAWLAIVKP
jgi:hypothetical protein